MLLKQLLVLCKKNYNLKCYNFNPFLTQLTTGFKTNFWFLESLREIIVVPYYTVLFKVNNPTCHIWWLQWFNTICLLISHSDHIPARSDSSLRKPPPNVHPGIQAIHLVFCCWMHDLEQNRNGRFGETTGRRETQLVFILLSLNSYTWFLLAVKILWTYSIISAMWTYQKNILKNCSQRSKPIQWRKRRLFKNGAAQTLEPFQQQTQNGENTKHKMYKTPGRKYFLLYLGEYLDDLVFSHPITIPVQFLVRAHAWVADPIPSPGMYRR